MLQVRGVMKIGTSCKAYNTYGDLMTLTADECNYYLQEPGRVHKPYYKEQVDKTEPPNAQIKPKEQI